MRYEPEIRSAVREEIIDGKKWCVVTIEDNGIGWYWDDMPRHAREKYIKTRENIELLGGKFYYENTPKKGAMVTIKLPLFIRED